MSLLKYRLKSGKSPQGRQKIYFCCHPDDFDLYFDQVCDDIFSKEENCAIYYEADPRGRYDRGDLLFQLGEMQLFVVPITRRLLTQPSRALDLELPFALGKVAVKDALTGKDVFRHIAVLPILFEGDLVDLFNETEPFDGIQFLDKYNEDSTAISYGEKLTKFLRSVIVSGEDDEKIRSEFKADIFLSYRKIDRAVARRLMEHIHRNDFCRDVSIWYDEYLVPGESWAEAINNELDASDLFVLNVTPKLLEEGNFVWREEYPTALNSGKPILPVMTEETDEAELSAMYDHIEEQLVRESVPGELEEGLIWGLVRTAGKEELLTPDDDSAHLYYIGLAYKNSVGVETNSDRAVRLLEDAGKRGWRRAYLTLGGMYEHGDGVERDEDRAIQYYRDFIRLQTPDFGTSKQGDLDLVLAYDAIGMIYVNRSRLADAFDNYAELNKLIDAMTSCFGSFKQINLPTSYERLGFIKRAMGEPAAAQDYFSKALQARLNPPITTNIATAEDAAQGEDAAAYNEFHTTMGLAVSLYSLGEICLQNRDLKQAEEHLTKANQLFAELAQEKDDRDLQLDLNKSYTRMAQLKEAQGDRRHVVEYYTKALEALEPICKNEGDIEARSMRVVTTAFLSGWYRDSGNLRKAYELICDATDEAEALTERDQRPKMMNLLSTTYGRRATIEKLMGNFDAARSFCEKEIKITEQLVKESEDAEYKRNLAIAYERLAKLLSKSTRYGDDELAITYLLKDLEITKEHAKDRNDLQAQRDLSVCYDALYNAYLRVNYGSALMYGVKGLLVSYYLAEKIGQPKELYELGISYYDVGRICADVFEVCFKNALALCERAYRESRSPEIKQMIKNLRELMKLDVNDIEFPLGPGYCGSLNELASQWLGGEWPDRDYEDISPFMGPTQGGGAPGDGDTSTTDDEMLSTGAGCMQLLMLMVIGICGILQWTGLVDIKGFMLDKLGPQGPTIFAVALFAAFASTCVPWWRLGKKSDQDEGASD
ncbi:MAG: toll/interleukin-1 receptor domain-containing protein [Coriobacteriales bacterium]|nr:toll/interleukin-1 receptor domain-containing protein [Coriobacteriales bacterium]